jgi:tRNA-splicing ligase RtcB
MLAMDGNDLLRLGYRPGHIVGLALKAAKKAQAAGASEEDVKGTLLNVLNMPETYADDPVFGQVAGQLIAQKPKQSSASQHYDLNTSAPYRVWGSSQIEPGALDQLKRAVRLPVAVRGALMPDAHQGYGLPIGGVLATWNSVIPYAVGVDIACRMRLTVFDAAPYVLEQKRDKFRKILEEKTRFGTGAAWAEPRDHEVMDDPAWSELSAVRRFKDIAWQQLGTSGSGNHFVEFGALKVNTEIDSPLGKILPGNYLALLSHSGSRRLGTEVANFYTDVAMQQRSHLPKDFLHLAWLDLNTDAGAEYWAAMTLAGKYASANHAVIHRQIIDALRFPVLGGVENHHNFGWKELLDGEEVIVHRKGATPAGVNELGVIPGSMSSPGYVVRGKGNPESLNSAAHGAGRRMSRSEAKKKFDWNTVRRKLKQDGVDLLSAGLDEVPGAYKDIRQVMSEQADLVEELAEFQPRMVKMAGEGQGRPED